MTRSALRNLGAIVTAGLALSACDQVEKVQNAAESGLSINGVVKDSYGKPVEGAEVLVYAFMNNLDKFGRPGEFDPGMISDPMNYKVHVDLGELENSGVTSATTTSGADGSFTISGLGVDGVILLARKAKYANDIAGASEEDGTISLATALKPQSADQNELTATIVQNFVLAGGPVPDVDGDDAFGEPVVPPAPPTVAPPPDPPAPPTEAPPECVSNDQCADGGICKMGECQPQCSEATVAEDCAPGEVCRENKCGPECLGHSDCADHEICNATTLVCEAEQCTVDGDCAQGICSDADTLHGYCTAGCAVGDGTCEANNQICDAELLRCRYECLANTECAEPTPLCETNHCVATQCPAEGCAVGYCEEFVCKPECGGEIDVAVCTDRNMVCDEAGGRCKIECVDDLGCEGNATGPLCENQHCAIAQCTVDDDCLADDKNGGLCIGSRCLEQCKADDDLTAVCGNEFAECPRARCVMPDPNELYPPAASNWASFKVLAEDGTELADASAAGAAIAVDKAGTVVHITGELTDGGDTIAYLRVQNGDSHCGPPAPYAPTLQVLPITLVGGKIVSDKGEFQEFVLSTGYQQLQLDANDIPGDGNESQLVTVAERCDPAAPTSPLQVTMSWGEDRVDVDLHVWNEASEETYYGSRYEGTRRQSSYGRIDVDDRNGYGPEVFTLNDDVAQGTFTVRARYFAGPAATPASAVKVRVVRKTGDLWTDETFEVSAPRRAGASSGWVDIGVFSVGPDAAPIPVENL